MTKKVLKKINTTLTPQMLTLRNYCDKVVLAFILRAAKAIKIHHLLLKYKICLFQPYTSIYFSFKINILCIFIYLFLFVLGPYLAVLRAESWLSAQ